MLFEKKFVRRYKLRFSPRRNIKALEEFALNVAGDYSQVVEEINAMNPEEDEFEETDQVQNDVEPTNNRRSVYSPNTSNINFLMKNVAWPTTVKDRFVREIQQARKSQRNSVAFSGLIGNLSREIESPRRKSAVFNYDPMIDHYAGLDEEFQFDKVMNFQIYFPHNNLIKIIERMNIKDRRLRQESNDIRRLKYHLKRFLKAIDKEKDTKAKPSSRVLTQDGVPASKVLEQSSNRAQAVQDTSIFH